VPGCVVPGEVRIFVPREVLKLVVPGEVKILVSGELMKALK